MANVKAYTTTEAEVALAAATPKTIMQLVAAANHRVLCTGFSVSFDGVSPTAEPVQVDIVRQSDAGTSSAATPVKNNESDGETLQTTSRKNATVEPTTGDVLMRYEVHPQGGGIEKLFGPGQEIVIKGGNRLAIRCTAPAIVNATGFMFFEE